MNLDIIIIISPIMFILGGRAIFILIVIIHIIDSWGLILNRPLIMMILRVFIFSYIMLVRRNMHDDVSPWVNIITILPYCPSFELDIVAITKSPMCLIDE